VRAVARSHYVLWRNDFMAARPGVSLPIEGCYDHETTARKGLQAPASVVLRPDELEDAEGFPRNAKRVVAVAMGKIDAVERPSEGPATRPPFVFL
jgi:hypothetical protein